MLFELIGIIVNRIVVLATIYLCCFLIRNHLETCITFFKCHKRFPYLYTTYIHIKIYIGGGDLNWETLP